MFSFFFFKQKTAYEMRISDWSSDVCSSDLISHAIAFPYDDPRQLHPVPSRRKDYGGDPADWDGATSGWKALFIARSNDHVVGYAMMSEYWNGMADQIGRAHV